MTDFDAIAQGMTKAVPFALFTVAETASGAAFVGAFAEGGDRDSRLARAAQPAGDRGRRVTIRR